MCAQGKDTFQNAAAADVRQRLVQAQATLHFFRRVSTRNKVTRDKQVSNTVPWDAINIKYRQGVFTFAGMASRNP